MRGASFEFHPSVQGFDPNDRMAYGLYEVLDAIALFRTGHRQRRRGTGRRRHRLKYSNPMLVAGQPPIKDEVRPRILTTTRPRCSDLRHEAHRKGEATMRSSGRS